MSYKVTFCFPLSTVRNSQQLFVSCAVIQHWCWHHGSLNEKIMSLYASILIKLVSFLSFQAQRHITDLYEDLRDGHNLISLLEVLSGETLVSFWWYFTSDIRICASSVTPLSCLGISYHPSSTALLSVFAVVFVLLSSLLIVNSTALNVYKADITLDFFFPLLHVLTLIL